MKDENPYKKIHGLIRGEMLAITSAEQAIHELIIHGPTKGDIPEEIKAIFEEKQINLYYSSTPYNLNKRSPAIENYLAFIIALHKELEINDFIDKIPIFLKKTTQAEQSLQDDSLPPPSQMFSDDSHGLEKIDPELLKFIYNQIIESKIHENEEFSYSTNSSISQQEHITKPPQSNTEYALLQKKLLSIIILSRKILQEVIDEAQEITSEEEPKNISKKEKATTREEARKTILEDEQRDMDKMDSSIKEIEEILSLLKKRLYSFLIPEKSRRDTQTQTEELITTPRSDPGNQGGKLLEVQPDPSLSILEKSTSDAQTQTEGPTTTLGSKPRKQGGNSATPLRNSVRCCTIS